jgi:drug/metabolite transporter (DMT)-like permease
MRRRIWIGALALGIAAVSFAATLIRLADAPALVTAAFRLSLAALFIAPLGLARSGGELRQLRRRDALLAIGAGAFLALHFATWISSLQYTTVASSVALVTTAPVWVALVSRAIWREPLSRATGLGILVAVGGGMLIGGGDLAASPVALSGDALALVGAWGGAGYYLLGRALRRQLSLLAYVTLVYSVAALLLVGLAQAARQTFSGYAPVTYVLFLLLALGPQIVGHSSFNYALKFLSATFVTVVILAEPVGATALAFFILHETPALIVLAGGALILLGIALASVGERRSVSAPHDAKMTSI